MKRRVRKSRSSAVLKEAEGGARVSNLCRKHGILNARATTGRHNSADGRLGRPATEGAATGEQQA
jgi:transposase-like protein